MHNGESLFMKTRVINPSTAAGMTQKTSASASLSGLPVGVYAAERL
jgi:hypothetical protein